MTTIDEKNTLKILNYYNEMSCYTKQVQYPNVQFLGIKYIYNNPMLCFKLQSGAYFKRQLNNNSIYYENVITDNDNK